jgi:hypothetical protein
MRLALFLSLLAFVNTCQEEEEPEIITCWFGDSCIDERIREIQNGPVGDIKATVTIIFTSDTFYYYVSGLCCDKPNELLDSQCNVVCTENGGPAAHRALAVQCSELEGETRRDLVWEDSRQ